MIDFHILYCITKYFALSTPSGNNLYHNLSLVLSYCERVLIFSHQPLIYTINHLPLSKHLSLHFVSSKLPNFTLSLFLKYCILFTYFTFLVLNQFGLEFMRMRCFEIVGISLTNVHDVCNIICAFRLF